MGLQSHRAACHRSTALLLVAGQGSASHELPVIIKCSQLLNKPQITQSHMPKRAQLTLHAPGLQTEHAEQLPCQWVHATVLMPSF